MSLPATGSTNWGVPLNAYITNTVLAEATLAEQTVTTHLTAPDPHGDRAYALGLVTPITSGVNQPNGYVTLNSSGRLNTAIMPTGGGRTDTIDVVADFQTPVSTTFAGLVDCSTSLNAALTATATAGGGEVWCGGGYYGIGETLVIPANTWLHLAPGAVFVRIIGTGGTAPRYMAANYGSASTAGASNIQVQGGTWNYTFAGTGGSAMAFAAASFIEVGQTTIQPLSATSSIVFAGIASVTCRDVEFQYPTPTGARSAYLGNVPAIQIACTQALTGIPASITTNAPCVGVTVNSCANMSGTASDGSGLYTSVNGLVGSGLATSAMYHSGIGVSGCYSNAFPGNALNGLNWAEASVLGNVFNFNSASSDLLSLSWLPTTPPASANITPDFWHDMRPCASGFNGTNSGQVPPQYRMDAEGTVTIYGSVGIPLTGYATTPVFASDLPAAYCPTHEILAPVTIDQNGSTNLVTTPAAQIFANGSIQFVHFPAGLPSGTLVYFEVSYPAAGTNGVIGS